MKMGKFYHSKAPWMQLGINAHFGGLRPLFGRCYAKFTYLCTIKYDVKI